MDVYIYIYIAHNKRYNNCTGNQEIWLCVRNMHLTSKDHVKNVVYENHEVIHGRYGHFPVVLCFRYKRKYGFKNAKIVYEWYMKVYLRGQKPSSSKVWKSPHTWESILPASRVT